MSGLFLPSDSKGKKIFIVFLFVSMISVLYSFLVTFFPSEMVKRGAIPVSLAFSLIYLLPFILHSQRQIIFFPVYKKIFVYVGYFLLSFLLSFMLIVHSIPSIFTSFLGAPYEFSAIIEKKSKHHLKSGCRHSIELEGIGYIVPHKICVSSLLWENVKPGDEIYIYSLRSALGIKVTAFRY